MSPAPSSKATPCHTGMWCSISPPAAGHGGGSAIPKALPPQTCSATSGPSVMSSEVQGRLPLLPLLLQLPEMRLGTALLGIGEWTYMPCPFPLPLGAGKPFPPSTDGLTALCPFLPSPSPFPPSSFPLSPYLPSPMGAGKAVPEPPDHKLEPLANGPEEAASPRQGCAHQVRSLPTIHSRLCSSG